MTRAAIIAITFSVGAIIAFLWLGKPGHNTIRSLTFSVLVLLVGVTGIWQLLSIRNQSHPLIIRIRPWLKSKKMWLRYGFKHKLSPLERVVLALIIGSSPTTCIVIFNTHAPLSLEAGLGTILLILVGSVGVSAVITTEK